MTIPDLSETLYRDRMEALDRYQDWERESARQFPGRRHARWRRKHCSNGEHLMKLAREAEPVVRCAHCIAFVQTQVLSQDFLASDKSRTW